MNPEKTLQIHVSFSASPDSTSLCHSCSCMPGDIGILLIGPHDSPVLCLSLVRGQGKLISSISWGVDGEHRSSTAQPSPVCPWCLQRSPSARLWMLIVLSPLHRKHRQNLSMITVYLYTGYSFNLGHHL